MIKVTQSAEAFFRSSSPSPSSRSTGKPNSTSTKSRQNIPTPTATRKPPPPRPPPTTPSPGEAAAAAADATMKSSSLQILPPVIVQPETMQRSAAGVLEETPPTPVTMSDNDSNDDGIRSGNLRPPGELGHNNDDDNNNQDDASNNNNNGRTQSIVGIHPRGAAVRRRSTLAIKHTMTQAATAAAGKSSLSAVPPKRQTADKHCDAPPSRMCTLTYQGVEVMFATSTTATTSSTEFRVYGIHSRTRTVFQTLDLPSPTSAVISLTCNSVKGIVAIAFRDGTIQTYAPVPTDPNLHAFGRYRWITSYQIKSKEVFYQPDEQDTVKFRDLSHPKTKPGEAVVMSLANDGKLLVGHRDQLAVFDVLPTNNNNNNSNENGLDYHHNPSSSHEHTTHTTQRREATTNTIIVADMLWTTTMTGPIVTARFSGDGQSLAVVTSSITSGGRVRSQQPPYGVHVFSRDQDDGSALEQGTLTLPNQIEQRARSIGILYHPGPFLFHAAPVTRISFREQGHNTSNVVSDDDNNIQNLQGNDLLLTYCQKDCMARIFNQNSWKQLVEWTTPRDSRVDWVRGIAAFSLGDLETQKRMATNTKQNDNNNNNNNAPHIGSPRMGSQQLDGNKDGFYEDEEYGNGNVHNNGALHNSHHHHVHSVPSSSAGAWISELTFRGAFPALRLSRLSYLKRGSESIHPALFNSVATILPAGSIGKDTVLGGHAHDETFSLTGTWPAWNPWLSESSSLHGGGHHNSEDTLRGSAMSFLGLSSGPPSSAGAYFGEGLLGGTHSPPCEIQIVSSDDGNNQNRNNIVTMEIPLWGDREQGELELGKVVRFVLSLSEIDVPVLQSDNTTTSNSATTSSQNNNNSACIQQDALTPKSGSSSAALSNKKQKRKRTDILDSTNFESDRLVARIQPDLKSVSITWRKQGTMSVVHSSWKPDTHDNHNNNNKGVVFNDNLLMDTIADACNKHRLKKVGATRTQRFQDVSVVPVPLSLPALCLPRSAITVPNETIGVIKWWLDENFGGPPLLLAVTTAGTIVLFEIPPPWSALEPAMPDLDPFLDASEISVQGGGSYSSGVLDTTDSDNDDSLTGDSILDASISNNKSKKYDVMITPHPDFGLGLRLESQMDGLPAVAGSYKKHPLTNGMLPAEKGGMIVLGDELISVNGVSLEGITFDEIISTVRQVASSDPGRPLAMRFRHVPAERKVRLNSLSADERSLASMSQTGSSPAPPPLDLSRRSMEQMLGVSPKVSTSSGGGGGSHRRTGSNLSVGGAICGEGEEAHFVVPPPAPRHRRTGSSGSVMSFASSKQPIIQRVVSSTTICVGADTEVQQEFCRITALVPRAFPSWMNTNDNDPQSCFVLIPWNKGIGTPKSTELRGAAMLLSTEGSKIHAQRLEVDVDCKAEKAKVVSLGTYDISTSTTTTTAMDDYNNNSKQKEGEIIIKSLHSIEWGAGSDNTRCIAVCDNHNRMRLVFVTIENNNNDKGNDDDKNNNSRLVASFRQYSVFQIPSAGEELVPDHHRRVIVRTSSVGLLATMHCEVMDKEHHGQQVITVWSARPCPSGTSLSKKVEEEKKDDDEKIPRKNEFASSRIVMHCSHSCSNFGDNVVDFCFMQSGFLDSFPLLVVFTRGEAIVYQRVAENLDWKPMVELSYCFLAGMMMVTEHSSSSSFNKKRLHFGEAELTTAAADKRSPIDTFPHLLPALRSILPSYDETKYLRSDWHPDSLLAYICTEEKGTKLALKRHVRHLFKVLSEDLPSNNSDADDKNAIIPEITANSDGTAATTTSITDNTGTTDESLSLLRSVHPTKSDEEEDDYDDDDDDDEDEDGKDTNAQVAERAADLFAMTTTRTTTMEDVQDDKNDKNDKNNNTVVDKEKQLLRKLQSVLADYNKSEKSTISPSYLHISSKATDEKDATLPVSLRSLSPDEIYMLWALGEVALKPPSFKSLDIPGQMFVFAMNLFHKIMDERTEDDSAEQDSLVPDIFASQKPTKKQACEEKCNQLPFVASAGCFAALLSDYQGQLIKACRKGHVTVDWDFLRRNRVPFWLRSDTELAELSVEAGQNIYKKGRDILESALFFIVGGKIRKLEALAATDSSTTGRTFRKFMHHDFTTERGRLAAEKNAYSLLRKRRYKVAAAFFLLADPPILKSAVEVIATKMEDLDLAFLVARLMGNRKSNNGSSNNDFGSFGGGLTLGGRSSFMMNGGIGYAGIGAGIEEDKIQKDKEQYKDWKPKLGIKAIEFLQERALPMSAEDNCLVAVQLMWLNRREEASWCLTGLSGSITAEGKDPPKFEISDSISPEIFHRLSMDDDADQRDQYAPRWGGPASAMYNDSNTEEPKPQNMRVVTKSNVLIGFVAGPMLLKSLDASVRSRFASALTVSGSLMRCGIDLPSIRTVLQNVDPRDLDKENIEENLKKTTIKQDPVISNGGGMHSSIFDSFDAAPPPQPKKSNNDAGTMNSSIFDSFDAPPPPPKSKKSSNDAGGMNSSIFDSFDTAPPPRPKKSSNDSGGMNSSIFDSFDTAPPKPPPQTKKSSNDSGAMNSSIFDSFDTAPPKPPPQPKKSSNDAGAMNSSIFDSFDTAPPKPPPQPKKSSNDAGAMNSSIFDSFDAAPQPKKSSNDAGAMNSSIFDSFDAAPQPKKSSNDAGAMNSSIFDSFEAAPQPKKNTNDAGAMNSSIFDSFDAAPRPPQPKKNTNDAGAMNSSIFDSFDAAPRPPKPAAPPATANGGMNSSIFDSFDAAPGVRTSNAPSHAVNSSTSNLSEKKQDEQEVEILVSDPTPKLWIEWREQMLVFAAARRLLREVSREIAELCGDACDPPVSMKRGNIDPLIPSSASEVLQYPCEADSILSRVKAVLARVCKSCDVKQGLVLQLALHFLASPRQYHRMFLAVLLDLVAERGDLAEDLVRNASHSLINQCTALASANDDLLYRKETLSHNSNQYLRRHAARSSWQLELCLWLHRGGGLPLSGNAINEAIAAVRIGLVVSSWNSTFECLETMIRCEPDCILDAEAGRQLWNSLKMVSHSEKKAKSSAGTGSGGWEFLVDCRRSEATDILRHKPTGCFIIRPHAEDHGVFTLSFKTNLVPTEEVNTSSREKDGDERDDADDQQKGRPPRPSGSGRPVRKDDVVQHAIIRLSDSGFRCGSFGPFATLMKLLDAVSTSLPFQLRFDLPPKERVILDEGSQPSPNSVFLRKFVLRHADGINKAQQGSMDSDPGLEEKHTVKVRTDLESSDSEGANENAADAEENSEFLRRKRLGLFLELLVLSLIRKQLSSVVSAEYENLTLPHEDETTQGEDPAQESVSDSDGASYISELSEFGGQYAIASRILRPLLSWCRVLEICCEFELTPTFRELSPPRVATPQITLSATESEIEVTNVDCGDSLVRCMIQPNSGVEFRTLKLSDGSESTLVILFSKKEAIGWLVNYVSEKSVEAAIEKLAQMEKKRVIEPIDLGKLPLKAYTTSGKSMHDGETEEGGGVRYRFVDPWEVEALSSREGETRSASIGRERFLAFSLGRVATSCEDVFRSLGGLPVLELWTTAKGGVSITKAIASVHPTWERGAGGDLQLVDGGNVEPPPFINSIRQHLYRNCLFRRIGLPQRFLALLQVELLDLKNLTVSGGSSSLTAYALLRLRRTDSRSSLTSKTRTLDSAATQPVRLAKSSGPNAPASWGSVVRFRFPLPEDVSCDGVSLNPERELLFEGPPCVLQLSVYEKKLLHDNAIGDSDVKIDGLTAGGQLEEWVPLRNEKSGVKWFARIRLTLRFELMCLGGAEDSGELAPSVGLQRIQELSQMGGAHEDIRKSASTPDLLSYFESMVY